MKILIGANVFPDPNSGAAGTVVHTTQALRELGHEVDEIWASDIGRRIQHGNLHYLLELPKRYRDVVQERCSKKEYDVIQLSQPYAWLAAKDHQERKRKGVFVNRSHGLELMADAAVSEWHKKFGIPENSFPRSVFTQGLRRLLHKQSYKIARYCDGILVPAQDIADFLVSELDMPQEKIGVVAHGVPDDFVSKPVAPMTAERMHRLLYVGQFSFIKGPHILAQVFNRILKERSECAATWVCSASHHPDVRQLLDPMIENRVHLQDWVTQEELIEIYDRHGLFLFTSFYEGAAKATLEALCRGLCVVASRVGAIQDYIEDGENGFLIAAGDVTAYLEKAKLLMSDLTLSRRISESARAKAVHYTWERCAENAVVYYEELLSRKSLDH